MISGPVNKSFFENSVCQYFNICIVTREKSFLTINWLHLNKKWKPRQSCQSCRNFAIPRKNLDKLTIFSQTKFYGFLNVNLVRYRHLGEKRLLGKNKTKYSLEKCKNLTTLFWMYKCASTKMGIRLFEYTSKVCYHGFLYHIISLNVWFSENYFGQLHVRSK